MANDPLYPVLEPFRTGVLERPGGARIYFEVCGNPNGSPVTFLHGGPGSGCTPAQRRYFDPAHHLIVLFDQRGAGRSTPTAQLAGNTTAALVDDMAALLQALGIGKIGIAGSSWGTTLALAFAQAHPAAVSFLVLTGVFLGTDDEIAWWYAADGVARFYRREYQRLAACAPAAPSAKALVAHYLALMQSVQELAKFKALYTAKAMPGLDALRASAIYRWTEYEAAMSYLEKSEDDIARDIIGRGPEYLLGHSLIEAHYFDNSCFLKPQQLLDAAPHIRHIPTHIVQSAYDMVCPPCNALKLHEKLGISRFTQVPRSGHALNPESLPHFIKAIANMRV